MSDPSVDAPTIATTVPTPGTVGAPPAVDLAGHTSVGDLTLDVRLKVHPGELVAVVGPNGAGKTTLLRLVAGLVALDAGSLSLGGRVVDDATSSGFVTSHRRRVGWVPQDRLLFDHLPVAANVGFSPRATPERVAHLLAELDLVDLADRRPTDCSGGQAQRVAVARALAGAPDVLRLGAPSPARGAASRRRGYRPREGGERPAARRGTHDPGEAAGLADRVVELATGQVVGDAP